MKKIIILSILFVVIGCKSTKTVDTSDKVKTVYVNRFIKQTADKSNFVVKTMPIDIEQLFNPCDSLGNVLPIDLKVKSGTNIVYIKNEDGQLRLQVQLDSTVQRMQKDYFLQKTKDSLAVVESEKVSHSKETTITVWSKWTYIFLLWGILATFLLLSKFRKMVPVIF